MARHHTVTSSLTDSLTLHSLIHSHFPWPSLRSAGGRWPWAKQPKQRRAEFNCSAPAACTLCKGNPEDGSGLSIVYNVREHSNSHDGDSCGAVTTK